MNHLRPLRSLRATQQTFRLNTYYRYNSQSSAPIQRHENLAATPYTPTDGHQSQKKGFEIPFPSYRGLKWLVPIAIGSMVAYVYFLEPYKYKKLDVISLNQTRFAGCKLLSKDNVSATSSIFSLKHGKIHGVGIAELWQSGTWCVEVKQPQLQISRFYTPLPPIDAGGRLMYDEEELFTMRLLVRREQNGEVSNYLHGVPTGSRIEVRGPYPELKLPVDTEEVVFIAGGTGIAPAMQVAYALATRRSGKYDAKKPLINILWASRTEDDAFGPKDASDFIRELTPIKQLEKIGRRRYNEVGIDLTVKQFVDDKKQFIQKRDLDNLIKPISATQSKEKKLGKKVILVSGPDGFVEHIAGAKRVQNGQEVQGPIQGLLGKVDSSGWEIIKL